MTDYVYGGKDALGDDDVRRLTSSPAYKLDQLHALSIVKNLVETKTERMYLF